MRKNILIDRCLYSLGGYIPQSKLDKSDISSSSSQLLQSILKLVSTFWKFISTIPYFNSYNEFYIDNSIIFINKI